MKTLGAALLAACLAACGGSGGDGDSGATPAPAPSPAPAPQALPNVAGGTARLLAGSLAGECSEVHAQGAITFHAGAVWLAGPSCVDGGARVQAVDAASGAVRLHASAAPNDAAAARANGFGYATGIAFDGEGRLFVMDGGNALSRWPSDFSAIVTPAPGHASGLWQIEGGGMRAWAGGVLNTRTDGAGEAAGFVLANGLVRDAHGHFYTQDMRALRRITPQAEVSTLAVGAAGLPVMDASGQPLHVLVRTGEASALVDADTGTPVAELPRGTGMALIDRQGGIYAAGLSAPGEADPVSVYHRAPGASAFEPVVTHAEYLNAMALDEAGNMYLHQRNAIVKVVFTR
ncbi:MAG: hypothetical protein Q4G71_02845 [Pseudomonadota bacterium]|nr:hypothetical protein [Pseudomonadota bacterium]